MHSALLHRGPDDEGKTFVEGDSGGLVGLAHRRLSIVDLSAAGRQPMANAAGDCWIAFNGEIYNHRRLREQLERSGAAFRTGTDTEVILQAYDAWGIDALPRLHGMFAFCLVDRRRGAVWLCRDRLGQKPLYLRSVGPRGLVFASEVRALLAAGPDLVPRRLHKDSLASFLAQGMVCGNDTIIEGVRSLPAATSLLVDFEGRALKQQVYWTPPRAVRADLPAYADSVAAVREALFRAVDDHLTADVPTGVFLSGGVDSTVLATVASEVRPSRVNTITIGFDDPAADESSEAAAIASELGTAHQTVRLVGDEMLGDIEGVFDAMDQPTVDGFNTFFVARAARRAGLTVALSGVGGDELFGGYASFRDVPLAVHASQVAQRLGPAAPLLARAAVLSGGRRGVKVAETLLRTPDIVGAYLLRRELFLERERDELLAPGPAIDRETGVAVEVVDELRKLVDERDLIGSISRLELSLYTRYMLLRDADVFSMASALELRVPLLDDRVVDVVSRVPAAFKNGKPYAKALLIDAAGPRLPRCVVHAPKRGFAFPWDTWLRGPLRARACAVMADADLWRSIGISPHAPANLWSRYVDRDPRVVALQIMALWVLSEYMRKIGVGT